jgi:polar amino acid transport system substrate-binding protein
VIIVTPALRSEIAPTGTLRIGLNMSNFLLTRTDAATGKPAGVAHDIGLELARRLDLPTSMHTYPNPGAVSDAAAKNEWDVCFLAAEPQRADAIDFSGAYVEIDATYLVPSRSSLQSADEVDRDGIRIIAPNRAAYELYLSRTLKHASVTREPGADASFKRFVLEKFDALAGLRPRLNSDLGKLPGSRILEGRFTAVQQAAGVPKGRPLAASYLREFIEDVRNSGLVARAISDNHVSGLTIVEKI